MAINNPYVPGDPYSYDLKWMVQEVKKAQAVGEEAAASAEAAAASAERAGDWEADARLYAQNAELSANNAAASAEDAARIVAPITQTLNTQGQQISVLEGRMDTFASLPEGSTTADAELQDIRVAADGTVYPTAGNAVRSQVNGLQDEVDEIGNVVFKDEIIIDAIDEESYEEAPSTVRIPHLFNFIAGKKYKLSVIVNSGVFLSGTNTIRANLSPHLNDSTLDLSPTYLAINNVTASPIIIGHEYTAEFTPETNYVNLLMRYKFDAGAQNITVKCYEITNIREELSTKIQNEVAVLTQSSRMLMGAHRGAEKYAPPNSVAAYEIAGKMGFPWAWLAQIRWSADNTLYVMHDSDVSITTNGTGNIENLSDAYINSLLCNKISSYDYSQFTNDELRVPTLEKAIQICLRYGMKMCFRIEPFPNNMNTEQSAAIWNNFVNLIKEYGITSEEASYSAYNPMSLKLCIDLLGNVEICPFEGVNYTAQDYVDWFNTKPYLVNVEKKAVLILATSLSLNDVKLLHRNGIRVYAFTNSSTPSQELMENLATWGVDILQNPKYPKIPLI